MAKRDNDYTDLGIVFYQDTSPAGKTYIDARGKTVDCEELTDEFLPMQGEEAVKTATHAVGVPCAHAYWAYIEVSGTVAITLRLVSQYNNDPGAAPAVDSGWARMQIVNQDDGTTAAELTFDATGYYLIQTGSEHVSGRSRWEAKFSGDGSGIVRIAGRAV